MTTTLHAHVLTSSRDCDGGHGLDYITHLNDEEIAEHESHADGVNDFHDLHFKARVLSNHVSFSPLDEVTVTVNEHGFHMVERTEEGFTAAEVRWCEDEGCDDRVTVYDQYAQLAGY